MKFLKFISVSFFLLTQTANAQKFSLDTNYVQRFKDKIVVVLFNSIQLNSLDLRRNVNDTASTSLSYPTYRASFGLTLSYKGISFSFGTNAVNFIMKDQINEQKYKVGTTKISNFAFTYNPNRLRIELYYRSIIGFHEHNRAVYDPTFGSNSIYYQYPKMTSVSYGADIMWTFNGRKRFSIGAPFSYTTKQKKSAGSFMIYFGANKTSITSDVQFIPVEVASQYGPYTNLRKFEGAALSWGAGYGYTIVIAKSFYINTIVIGRVPFMWRRFETSTGLVTENFSEPEDLDVIAFAIGRAAIGLNLNRFFVSTYIYADMYDYSYKKGQDTEIGIRTKNIRGAVLVGFRFNKPKKEKSTSSF